jgi:hypothetical protein
MTTPTTEELARRLALVEQSAPPTFGQIDGRTAPRLPTPTSDPDSWDVRVAAAQAAKREERRAAAQAEEDRLQAEREAAEVAAAAAEVERRRQWEAHRPKRETALKALSALEPQIAAQEDHLAALCARRRDLRTEAQRFGRPIGDQLK